MPFYFDAVPEKAQSIIFSHIPYSNLVKLRLVNRWFNQKCSGILNETFSKLKRDIEDELRSVANEIKAKETENENTADVQDDFDKITNLQLRYKILQILQCEISTLQAVCRRYVKLKMYTFAGGKILDYFKEIMSKSFNLTDAKNPLESHVTMQLFLKNEEFMDYFEEVIEPKILDNDFCPWFGVKMADTLDIYANSNYHISATCENQQIQMSGKYEILNPESATQFDYQESTQNWKKLVKLSRYVRNQMRWHNFFYYVDAPYESVKNIITKRDRQYNKFCLSSSDILEDFGSTCVHEEVSADKLKKTFNRRIGNPDSKENVHYGIELQCNKSCVPARLESFVESVTKNDIKASSSKGNMTDSNNTDSLSNEVSLQYYLILTVKVVIPSEDKCIAVENYIEVCHNDQDLKVVQSTKEIPI